MHTPVNTSSSDSKGQIVFKIANKLSSSINTLANFNSNHGVRGKFSGLKQNDDSLNLLSEIKAARSELERAEAYFNELTEAEAIDYAAYSILAARAKYSYLISLAKKQNIKL